jgi:hypothetical protein
MARLLALALLTGSIVFAGCASSSSPGDDVDSSGADLLSSKAEDEWFYGGPLPMLEQPTVTASLKGSTVRVSGLIPADTVLPDLPHIKTKPEGDKIRIDIVYPIATAANPHNNASPGNYHFQAVRAYRPNGMAFTEEDGEHFVTWGGFPFIAYDGGIAFHGPITDTASADGDAKVWELKRGTVSHGCNRMMGEHVVELTNLVGVNMRKLYNPNDPIAPHSAADVKIIADYDTYEGKFVDVDYPTDVGVTRPAKVHGDDNVVMFGSWVASDLPDGSDLPAGLEWEGGVSGKLYNFIDHAKHGFVCSMPKGSLAALKVVANRTGGILPADFCTKKLACDQAKGHICSVAEIGM